ncbi:MAG: class I SAM-dependent methyltransferase [Myxococcales bacterium]|nr:class I SAM-dependent methyltransferase [Myxococcales bacterium]
MMPTSVDRATRSFWQNHWTGRAAPRGFDPSDRTLANYVNSRFHQYFRHTLGHRGGALIELGCAQSTWLPYFARQFGFRVTGLDYSEVGCARAREMLDDVGVVGDVVCADMFNPPDKFEAAFDAVVSFGLIEHFEDTAAAVTAAARFVAPGGRMLTFVPNMVGLPGAIQRYVDRAIFDIHVPLDVDALRSAHEASGLTVVDCHYFILANWHVVNASRLARGWASYPYRAAVAGSSRLAWALEKHLIKNGANRLTSPYVVCVADKNP